MTIRYALYYAPEPDSLLWRFGSAVLGYDAASGADVAPLRPEGTTPEGWHAATADPRKYGFHATLKAPFTLAPERSEADLRAALEGAGKTIAAVDLGPCRVGVIPSGAGGGFVAITPATPPPSLATLERAVVTAFETWRAPLTPEDRARRQPDRLSARQRDRLDRYGYPFIFEDFTFHMTLTGRLDEPEPVAAALAAAAEASGTIGPIRLDRLALFRQDAADRRFRIVATTPLAAQAAMLPP